MTDSTLVLHEIDSDLQTWLPFALLDMFETLDVLLTDHAAFDEYLRLQVDAVTP